MTPRRGEIWWGEIEAIGRRPYLVLTRQSAIDILNSVIAAPVTRTVRRIPTELALGLEDGMSTECAASFDNVTVVPKACLVERISTLDESRLAEACAALRLAVDC